MHAALIGLSDTKGAIDVPFGSGRVKGMGTDQLSVTPLQFHFHSPSEHTINGELLLLLKQLTIGIAAHDGLFLPGLTRFHAYPAASDLSM